MNKIILASTSPRRKELLEQAGVPIIIIPSNYDETPLMQKYAIISSSPLIRGDVTSSEVTEGSQEDQMTPHELTKVLALEKAKDVAIKHPNSTILAADTIGFLEGRVLGKASSTQEAKQMIQSISGKTHSVITGYAIITTQSDSFAPPDKGELSQRSAAETETEGVDQQRRRHTITRAIESLVTFKKLTEQEIDKYIATNEWQDKSCCYAIQGKAKKLIKKHQGSLQNIIGLPIKEVLIDLTNLLTY